MKNYSGNLLVIIGVIVFFSACQKEYKNKPSDAVLYKNFILIDGNGGVPLHGIDMLVQDDTIAAIGENIMAENAEQIDLEGKTVMPGLISNHVHVGTLKGMSVNGENYTYKNIKRQLKQYARYGILNILSLGTDRPLLFKNNFYKAMQQDSFPGARMYSAGYGIGVPNGGPPKGGAMDLLYRPKNPKDVVGLMDSLALLKPAVVKIWVDDFGGQYKKMDPAVYKKIIEEAHKHMLRVAVHVYYLADARRLVADGVDILAHSVRDSLIDEDLIRQMKEKKVAYIPTLTREIFNFIFAQKPDWMDDEFYKNSLEPGVYQQVTSAEFQKNMRDSPGYRDNMAAYDMALKNLKKVFDAGILVSLGTDSGASPFRAQGFSEQLELELMVRAGLTPLEAISVGTKNAARLLHIDNQFGTLEKGKKADFIVLNANPAKSIENTWKIEAVFKAGKKISQ